ncbi:hypothetical protein GJ744_001284 [Endocarpon pusillum]|uniref:Uncharacterized protein n=1 Tax=Endocarpon pusillum TaxID=364733 RepID=A0A8H7A9G9_9EURO|nr:hypothetical protein GJ744_001284 [Endocarpon pusillum]
MNTLQPSENRLPEGDTSSSTGTMPSNLNYDPGFQYDISANSYVWPENFFTDQTFPLLDMPAGGTEFHLNSDPIGKPTSLPSDRAVPQACSCATAEYVLDLQTRIVSLEKGLSSRLSGLEAKFEDLAKQTATTKARIDRNMTNVWNWSVETKERIDKLISRNPGARRSRQRQLARGESDSESCTP